MSGQMPHPPTWPVNPEDARRYDERQRRQQEQRGTNG
jgi:hypothetical protein